MIKRIIGCVILCAGLIASSVLQAHHSLAATYDIRKQGEVTGVLTRVGFTNPHGAMHMDVTNEDGSITEWVLTTGSANTLANLGFGRNGTNKVVAGDTVTITYFPSLSGKPLGFIRSITLPDQREIQISTGSSRD